MINTDEFIHLLLLHLRAITQKREVIESMTYFVLRNNMASIDFQQIGINSYSLQKLTGTKIELHER